jgi:hypothetical protein
MSLVGIHPAAFSSAEDDAVDVASLHGIHLRNENWQTFVCRWGYRKTDLYIKDFKKS